MIKNNKIIVNDNPKEIYNNPKEKYVAALFDDINEIKINGNKHLLYPHQIKISDASDYLATVLNTYFKGSYWLIEASFQNQVLFFNHHLPLEQKKEIGFYIEKTT